MRRCLFAVGFLVPLTLSASAFAQEKKGCPPGSWFCESVDVQVNIGGGADDDVAQSPDDSPSADSTKKPTTQVAGDDVQAPGGDTADADDTVVVVKKKKRKKKRRREVVVEDPGGEQLVEAPSSVVRKKKQRRWRERFGLQLRLEGAAVVARDGNSSAGLGGAGASFRWRPSPYFAFDLGADIVGGTDYNGDDRVEFSGALSGILYFNPQHRVQVYAIGGIHLSHAEVDTPYLQTAGDFRSDWSGDEATRNYFGGHGGLGVEFRIARHFGMFVDALAIIRTRVDSEEPEFRDPYTGETTNTSGAGLFRTGVNFWW